MIWILLITVLNLIISWANSYFCGKVWAESKHIGGWLRVLVWCGAVQAAIGFSSVIGLVLTWIAFATGHIGVEHIRQVASLWYLLVIFPAIGTGLIIAIESIKTAMRTRSILDTGVAAYNTFATAHNIYQAVDGIPSAWSEVGDLFSDADDPKAALVLLIVAFAIGGGILWTYALIKKYSKAPIPLADQATA